LGHYDAILNKGISIGHVIPVKVMAIFIDNLMDISGIAIHLSARMLDSTPFGVIFFNFLNLVKLYRVLHNMAWVLKVLGHVAPDVDCEYFEHLVGWFI
jgi:hypothetical protein